MSKRDTELEQVAALALGAARGKLPLKYGITVIVHEYASAKHWTLLSSVTDWREIHRLLASALLAELNKWHIP